MKINEILEWCEYLETVGETYDPTQVREYRVALVRDLIISALVSKSNAEVIPPTANQD